MADDNMEKVQAEAPRAEPLAIDGAPEKEELEKVEEGGNKELGQLQVKMKGPRRKPSRSTIRTR